MKYRPSAARMRLFASCAVTMLLLGCNNNDQRNPDNPRVIPFDKARASRSIISIDAAVKYQRSFDVTRDRLPDSTFRRRNFNIPNAESFTRDAIILLLNQRNADGIRIYYGKDDSGQVRMVLLPIDANGKDIKTRLAATQTALRVPGVPQTQAKQAGIDEEAIERGQTCPPCQIQQ